MLKKPVEVGQCQAARCGATRWPEVVVGQVMPLRAENVLAIGAVAVHDAEEVLAMYRVLPVPMGPGCRLAPVWVHNDQLAQRLGRGLVGALVDRQGWGDPLEMGLVCPPPVAVLLGLESVVPCAVDPHLVRLQHQ